MLSTLFQTFKMKDNNDSANKSQSEQDTTKCADNTDKNLTNYLKDIINGEVVFRRKQSPLSD